jgi:hypothetical protein
LRQEDAELLRLVREWRPSDTVHPIAMQAWHIYEDGGLTLSDESMEKLQAALDGYAGDLVSLGQAIEGLTRFSILLSDHQNDPTGAEKVVVLMRHYVHRFEPFFERVAEAIANVGIATPALESESSNTNAIVQRLNAEPLG